MGAGEDYALWLSVYSVYITRALEEQDGVRSGHLAFHDALTGPCLQEP